MQKNIKIVLMDDDQDICDLMTMELTATVRFKVTTSTRSDTAIALISKQSPLPELIEAIDRAIHPEVPARSNIA